MAEIQNQRIRQGLYITIVTLAVGAWVVAEYFDLGWWTLLFYIPLLWAAKKMSEKYDKGEKNEDGESPDDTPPKQSNDDWRRYEVENKREELLALGSVVFTIIGIVSAGWVLYNYSYFSLEPPLAVYVFGVCMALSGYVIAHHVLEWVSKRYIIP